MMNRRKITGNGTALAAALLLTLSGCVGPVAERTSAGYGARVPTTADRQPVAQSSDEDRSAERMTEETQGTGRTEAPSPAVERTTEEAFLNGAANFSIGLLRQSVSAGENLLLSPYAALSVLSMTANGAAGETRTQMEHVLADGMPLDCLNRYMRGYRQALSSSKTARLRTAGSIWFRDEADRLQIEPSFLQVNTDFYDAGINKAPFHVQTVQEINRWVSEKTGGMIDRLVEELSPEDEMVLLSAIAFEAEWAKPYTDHQVSEGMFYTADGASRTVDMLRAAERQYLDDGRAVGFLKSYAGGRYQFLALLPNEGISPAAYAASLTGEDFRQLVRGAEEATVHTALPAFDFTCDAMLEQPLRALGMTDAFDEGAADFSRMGRSALGPLVIGSVRQKAFMQVSAQGTRAGAAASVVMEPASVKPSEPEKIYTVTLDRPFLYGIVDGETGLPLFLGIMADPAKKTGAVGGRAAEVDSSL